MKLQQLNNTNNNENHKQDLNLYYNLFKLEKMKYKSYYARKNGLWNKLTKEQKSKLRGAIKFFSGDRNNIAISVKNEDKILPCGAIYLTEEILKQFEEIVGRENINFSKVLQSALKDYLKVKRKI